MVEAFYEALGGGWYRSTALTRGPWDEGAQHAGPPSALLGSALETALGGPLARVTFEILKPVPIAELHVTTTVVRGGRSVRLAEGVLADGDGPVMLARAWTIRRADVALPAELLDPPDTIAPPHEAATKSFFPVPWDEGYHTAMDFRFVSGGFTEPGPARIWMRPRQPLVAGTELTPLQRVLCAADSGNGVSARFESLDWVFINTDLTVHLVRYPAGAWVSLDARTTLEPDGVGLARSVLRDEAGVIGHALQSLFIARG
ncbi:MAG: thioesterase family protein [Actinobacteria bacterium]|nr:thioesterase family protein [Actinomycetota bacterium]